MMPPRRQTSSIYTYVSY